MRVISELSDEEEYQELYSGILHSMSDLFVKNPEEPGVEYE